MRKTPFLILAMIAAVVAFGCERGAPAPKAAEHDHAKHDHAAPKAEPAPKEPPAPAGPRIETGAFLLAMTPAQPKYAVGKSGEVEIALEGRGEWHVNQEYPIRVEVKAPNAAGLGKRELLKDDAAEFGDKKVRFLAPVAPSAAGEHEVTCDVSFAMCTEENCVLERRTVAMLLEVQ